MQHWLPVEQMTRTDTDFHGQSPTRLVSSLFVRGRPCPSRRGSYRTGDGPVAPERPASVQCPAESAEERAELLRFRKEYFGNGQLHIVDAETGQLISRKDAYLPLNMWMARRYQKQIDALARLQEEK